MTFTICEGQVGACSTRLGDPLPTEQCIAAPSSTGTTVENTCQLAKRAQKRAQLIIDAAQAHWHLDLLGRDERDVHIRAIPHKGKRGFATNGNFAMDLERFQDLNNQGYGLYLQPNIGGTKAKDITLCTALFWEYDDRPRSEQVELWQSTVGLKPTFQTDTQGKSIHNYLVLDAPMDPEPWTLLMERLQLAAPGCDKNCKGANRMMRMAGSHYINRNGESQGQVQIINANGPRYSAEELDLALPPLPAAPQSWRKKYSTDSAPGLLQIADALECIPPRKGGDGTYGDYRQILWGLKDACIAAGADEDVAIQLMEQHSPSKTSQWNVAQVCRSGGEKVTAGTFWWHAKKHGWRPNHE